MDHVPQFRAPSYHRITMNPQILKKLLPHIAKILSKYEFDSIAFRGMSGAVLSMPIAMRLKKNLIMVRKPDDKNHHSDSQIAGDKKCQRYVIVDDFVSSGGTVRAIVRDVSGFAPEAKCLGVLEVLRLWDASKKRLNTVLISSYELRQVK